MKGARWIAALLLSLAVLEGHAQQPWKETLDDVLQYMPYVAVGTLKACGVDSRDDWTQLALTTAASWVASASVGYVLKHTVRETRPDGSDQKSFPSGHALVAITGATALHKEFGHISPWISVAGYGLATAVSVDRVVNQRHYWHDVLAGAGIGIAATELTWWLSDKVFKNRKEQVSIGFTGTWLDVAIVF